MKKNNSFLQEPRRQSYVAIILILFKFFRGLIRSLWPILLVFIFRPSENSGNPLIWIILGLSGVSVIGSIISYFRFYFFIEGEDLVIKKGIIRRSRLNVPFDRIQTVNFRENLVHRLFNVVSLEIDTAGSSGREFQIDALSREDATKIRNYLLAQKRKSQGTESDEETPEVEEELLMHLNPLDLLKIGVSENHIRTAFIILGFFLGVLNNIEEAIGMDITEMYNEYIGLDIHSFLGTVLLFVPVFILISFLITLVRTIMRFYNLRLWRSNEAFKLVSGLFNRRELSLPHRKIQLISRATNPIKKLFGFHTLRLYQAASDELGRKDTTHIPGIYPDQFDIVRDSYIPSEWQEDMEKKNISELIKIRYLLFFGVIPAIVLTIVQLLLGEWLGLLFLLWIPVSWFFIRIYYRKRFYKINREILFSHSGIIGDVEKWLKMNKVQAVRVRQTPYQRRKNIANIYLYTASGAMSIPYTPIDDALAIQDYLLYKVESSREPWM